MEDDAPTVCSCNHPFSVERPPNPDYTFVTPANSPPSHPLSSALPPPSLSITPTLSVTSPSPIPPTSSILAPIPVYPGRPANGPSPVHAHASHTHAHLPHAHGHIDAHVDAHAHDAEPHTAYSMQTLVYVHSLLCSTTSTQCIPHEYVKGVKE